MNLEKLRELRDEVVYRSSIFRAANPGHELSMAHTDLQVARINYKYACEEYIGGLLDKQPSTLDEVEQELGRYLSQ